MAKKNFELSTVQGRTFTLIQLLGRQGISTRDLDDLDQLEVGEVVDFGTPGNHERVAFTVTRLEDVEA